MSSVIVIEVSASPGIRWFRLIGELTESLVEQVAARLGSTDPPCDVVLDVRETTFRNGSAVSLFFRLAHHLAGRGRLYVLFAPEHVLRLVDDSCLEEELLNVKIVRHPAQPVPGRESHLARLRSRGDPIGNQAAPVEGPG